MGNVGCIRANPSGRRSIARSVGAIILTAMLGAPLALLSASDPAAATDPIYSGHVWTGTYFNGTTSTTATLIEADIWLPHWYPDAGDDFYVMISIYDSALRYDQIGFNAPPNIAAGTWQIAWAALTECSLGSGTFDRRAGLLSAGRPYHFSMEINGNGDVLYKVTSQGTEVFSHTEHTGGTYFRVESSTTCGGEPWWGYTDYEELYKVQEQAVPYNNFYFVGNKADGTTISNWAPYKAGTPDPSTTDQPLPKKIIGSGSEAGNVGIWNEWFDLKCDDCAGLVLSPGAAVSDLEVDLLLNAAGTMGSTCGSTCDVSVSVISQPSGWDVSLSPTGDTPPSTFYLDIDTPDDADGFYQIHLQADQGSGYFTRYQVHVTVWDGGPPDNDGGCVAFGTDILTPGGGVDVEDVELEDIVIGWDFSLAEATESLWTGVSDTLEVYGLAINDDALVIPIAGQRIYARTAEGTGFTEGWINNAIELQRGDLVFDAAGEQWVLVTSLTWTGVLPMSCNLATDKGNNFVANGFLVGGYLT